MSELSHGHKPKPRAKKSKGLFDGVEVVNYNTGNGFVDAYVAKADGAHKAFLVRFENGSLQQVNGGESVPERAESEYGPEGGGVTFTRKGGSNA